MARRILIHSDGRVSVAAVDATGQCNGTGLNEPGQSLREVIRRHEGDVLLVLDCLFGTGYHRVTTHCSAGGHGWGFSLVPHMTDSEAHDGYRARMGDGVTSQHAIAFERLEAAL